MGGLTSISTIDPVDAASPCTLVCTMDTKTGWCYGCGRTIDEIAGWRGLSFEQRRAVRQHLPDRMLTFSG